MTDLFDYNPSAADLAKDGMARAAEHADAVNPGWQSAAFEMLEGYALTHWEFMTEDVRVWAHGEGLPLPPDGRAWGAVVTRAIRSKLIECARYQKTRIPPAHATPRAVWRSQIFSQLAAA